MTELKLVISMLEDLGLKDLSPERDYWIIGALGLGLSASSLPKPIELSIIVTHDLVDVKCLVESLGIRTKAYYFANLSESGFEFYHKDFLIRVYESKLGAGEIAELRLFLAMKTLLAVHGEDLKGVLERYLSYGLNLERAFSEYFGWSDDWRERLLALPDPTSFEAIVRISS